MSTSKSVAVIGLGPAGAITIDALAKENAFDVIHVFERREKPGGCWIPDPPNVVHELPEMMSTENGTVDRTLMLPTTFPSWRLRSPQYRFTESSIYPGLQTNICATAMEFSQEPIPPILSEESIKRHGLNTPFRSHAVIEDYICSLVHRNGYEQLVSYQTTVELIEKVNGVDRDMWELTLRRASTDEFTYLDKASNAHRATLDYWYKARFDAVVVASGHYNVPSIPHIDGLKEFAESHPGSVEHSKSYRNAEAYIGKRVLTVGSSISGPDIAFALALAAEKSQQIIHSSIHSDRYHPYFGDHAFQHPLIQRHRAISRIVTTDTGGTVYFEDGSKLENVDHIIFGTGYSWTMPFLPQMEIRNNRVPGLYQHIFPMEEELAGILFVGAVAAGFTFKVFEWQAVAVARYLSGRLSLPPLEEQRKWELERMDKKGDGVAFTALYPDFQEYFDGIKQLVETATGQGGRRLPAFDNDWQVDFEAGHQFRINWWKRENKRARESIKCSV